MSQISNTIDEENMIAMLEYAEFLMSNISNTSTSNKPISTEITTSSDMNQLHINISSIQRDDVIRNIEFHSFNDEQSLHPSFLGLINVFPQELEVSNNILSEMNQCLQVFQQPNNQKNDTPHMEIDDEIPIVNDNHISEAHKDYTNSLMNQITTLSSTENQFSNKINSHEMSLEDLDDEMIQQMLFQVDEYERTNKTKESTLPQALQPHEMNNVQVPQHQPIVIPSYAPRIDISDPLQLMLWPKHLLMMKQMIHEASISSISASKFGKIIYLIRDNFQFSNNLSLECVLWLSRTLVIPVLAVVSILSLT